MNLIPGLSLRVSPEAEELGLDDEELGEWCYDIREVSQHIEGLNTPNNGPSSSGGSLEGGAPTRVKTDSPEKMS